MLVTPTISTHGCIVITQDTPHRGVSNSGRSDATRALAEDRSWSDICAGAGCHVHRTAAMTSRFSQFIDPAYLLQRLLRPDREIRIEVGFHDVVENGNCFLRIAVAE